MVMSTKLPPAPDVLDVKVATVPVPETAAVTAEFGAHAVPKHEPLTAATRFAASTVRVALLTMQLVTPVHEPAECQT